MDFYKIVTIKYKNGRYDYKVRPEFHYARKKDIICKGGEMYAWWDEETQTWCTSIIKLINHIDSDIKSKVDELKKADDETSVAAYYMNDDSSGIMARFKNYTSNCLQSENIAFNAKIIFADDPYRREDYSTMRLLYSPKEGSTEAFDTLIDTLYDPKEKDKILWFMGLLLTGNAAQVQKFMFLHGGKGTGKGTVIKIFKKVFANYCDNIDLQKLTSDSQFSTEDVKEIPLLVDEDCDMSAIQKDTNLLKLTAHEPVTVNKKYVRPYPVTFKGLLITASNQAYKVRDVDSGIMRRAITVYPSNRTFDFNTYMTLMGRIEFEIPAIAYKAIEKFNTMGLTYYNAYEDKKMAAETDYFLDFMRERYDVIKESMEDYGDYIPGSILANFYYDYLTDNEWSTKGYKKKIRSQAKRYFKRSYDKKKIDGHTYRNVYEGLLVEKMFDDIPEVQSDIDIGKEWIVLKKQKSKFDYICRDCEAQYANDKGTPSVSWKNNKTKLKDLDTSKLHYIRAYDDIIMMDFDIKIDGKKSLEANIEAASKFPKTYAEVSQSEQALHLYYIYDGDISKLSTVYSNDIEIKKIVGKSSFRRKLTLCNDLDIAHISTGLPIIEDSDKVYNDIEQIILNNEGLHTLVKRAIRKEYPPNHTRTSMNLIAKAFKTAYENGVLYDCSDLESDVWTFARHSTNSKSYCLGVADSIIFSSILTPIDEVPQTEIKSEPVFIPKEEITFFDIEVWPNLNFVVTKQWHQPCKVWMFPTPKDADEIMRMNLAGFFCREYDNHILWGMRNGRSPEALYLQSKKIVSGDKKGKIQSAKEISYIDIYDYLSTKQSLKLWEIEMAEKGYDVVYDDCPFDFDKPLPKEYWDRAIEYCKHDVEATEMLFEYKESDYKARMMLSALSGCSMNTPNNAQSERFLFQGEVHPEKSFNYIHLEETFPGYEFDINGIPKERYKFKNPKRDWNPKSWYMGEDPSEGGYVWSEPGVWFKVLYLDVTSLHPYSCKNMKYFGKHEARYDELLDARVLIKQGKLDECAKLFDGKLAPFLSDTENVAGVAGALKIILNSVYGMSSAKFDNSFKHPDNVDNIIAKRGALFMITLKNAIQEKGYKVVHIKTDSIKIANGDDYIMDFAMDFAKQYGYTFSVEDRYERMALVNRSVLIAQNDKGKWLATGAQFAEPYVFKSLFDTAADITANDFFLTKQVQSKLYLGRLPETGVFDPSQFDFIGRAARIYASKTGYDLIRYDASKNTWAFVTGTKGYKWKLSSEFTTLDDVDFDYYHKLVDDAIETINKVGPSGLMIDDPCRMYQDKLTYY